MCQSRIFIQKYDKSYENDKIINRHAGFKKDIEFDNAGYEEESVKRFIETD